MSLDLGWLKLLCFLDYNKKSTALEDCQHQLRNYSGSNSLKQTQKYSHDRLYPPTKKVDSVSCKYLDLVDLMVKKMYY